MTDDEIQEYLFALEPVYTPALLNQIDSLNKKQSDIENEQMRLNRLYFKDNTQEQRAAIESEQEDLSRSFKQHQARRRAINILADKEGVQKEIKRFKQMTADSFTEVEAKAQWLNILNNYALQLDKAAKLTEEHYDLENYTLTFGEVALLRGNWGDAEDAVEIINDTQPEKTHVLDKTYKNDDPYGWKASALEIAKQIDAQPRPRPITQKQLSEKVHEQMKALHAQGQPNMTNRSNRIPAPESIERHVLIKDNWKTK